MGDRVGRATHSSGSCPPESLHPTTPAAEVLGKQGVIRNGMVSRFLKIRMPALRRLGHQWFRAHHRLRPGGSPSSRTNRHSYRASCHSCTRRLQAPGRAHRYLGLVMARTAEQGTRLISGICRSPLRQSNPSSLHQHSSSVLSSNCKLRGLPVLPLGCRHVEERKNTIASSAHSPYLPL